MERYIFHCDLDCFFAAVEIRDNPEYEEKPVIIGADPKEGKGRGVVSTCNYEARKFGLHSAMPISQAYRLCPHGIYLFPNSKKYGEASKEVMNILNSYTSKFQQVGIDEAYLDMTEHCFNLKHAETVAKSIQDEILQKVGITLSIGCAPTKSIAKIASDYKKPNGITLVPEEEIKEFLYEMDITTIPGIGKKSKMYYNRKGFKIIGDFIDTSLSRMIELFGKNGEWVWNIVHGRDNREVKEFHEDRKSLSKERTFHKNTSDYNDVISKLEEINNRIHESVVKHDIYYRTVTLKIRLEGFLTFTRAKSLPHPIQNKNKVMKIILELLKEFEQKQKRVRLVGIKLSNLKKEISVVQTNILNYMNP